MKTKNKLLIIGILISSLFFLTLHDKHSTITLSPYPDGKNFAFTITDDPDGSQLVKIKPIYILLDQLGFKTTIACWVYKPTDVEGMPDPADQIKSETLENAGYVAFLEEYQKKGFEIALHTVTAGNDKRETTAKGYEKFKELFGEYPKLNIMHSKNKENIYWGRSAFGSPFMRKVADIYTKVTFEGEDTASPYFWGDIAKEKTKYVRMWGTWDINTLKFNPSMPYHDLKKPFVNYWFSFSDGFTAKYFNKLLSDKNIEKLVRERGASIVYTHFACGFTERGKDGTYKVNDETKKQLTKLAGHKDGWFVPASELLDRLLVMKNITINDKKSAVIVSNSNDFPVLSVTLLTKPGVTLYDSQERKYAANEDGEIIISKIDPKEAVTFFKTPGIAYVKNSTPTMLENICLVMGRLLIMLFSHRG